jgi:hypothetical protein
MDCQKTKAANDMPKYVATFTILDPYSSSFFASIQFQNQIDFVLHFFVEEELRWEGKVNCETVSITIGPLFSHGLNKLSFGFWNSYLHRYLLLINTYDI